MNTLHTDQLARDAGHLVDVVRSTVSDIDLGEVSDSISRASGALLDVSEDLAESAKDISITSGRVVRRAAVGSARYARRHPRLSIGGLVALIVVMAGIAYLMRRDDAPSEPATLRRAA